MFFQLILTEILFIVDVLIIVYSIIILQNIFGLPPIDYAITINKTVDCIIGLMPVVLGFILINVFWNKRQVKQEFITDESRVISFLLHAKKLISENGELIEKTFDPNCNNQKFERDDLLQENYINVADILEEILSLQSGKTNVKVESVKTIIKEKLQSKIKKCMELSINHYGNTDELSEVNSFVGDELERTILYLRRK